MIYAHTLTYPDFASSKEAVIDLQGHMVGGPDRKTDGEGVKWVEWQRAVKNASHQPGAVPQDVMSFFQQTKHLTKPPGTNVTIIEDAILVDPKPSLKAPRFTWSYTSLNQFLNTCPAQAAAERFYKTTKFQETEATKWGIRVHTACEIYLKAPTQVNLDALTAIAPTAAKMCAAISKSAEGATLLVEQQLCLNESWKPTGWFDKDAWGRGVVDVAVIRGDECFIYDHKTGKKKDDFMQLKIFALFIALHHPQVQVFHPKFLWYKESDSKNIVQGLPQPLHRKDLVGVFAEVKNMVERVKTMWDTETFPARVSGLCRQYCSNKSCPHCG